MENGQVAMTLTRRQKQIYDYLRENLDHFDQPPNLDELCQVLGLSSRGSLHKHIQALVEAGLVEAMDGKQRGIRLRQTVAAEEEGEFPFLGYIAAGRPIEALPNPETMEVPGFMQSGRPCYVLQVRGDSMIDEGIIDGDFVVIEQRNHARNGEIVVALIENVNATLKRIEQKPGEVILHPANPTMAPMRYRPEDVEIQGVLIGQMRKY